MKHLNFLFLFICFFSEKTQAQEEYPVLIDSEFQFNYGNTRWFHSLEIGNRNLLYVNENFYFHVRQIEFTHFTKYELNSGNEIGLGIRYRFKEVFDELERDEIRVMAQYGHSRAFTHFILNHELRLEQRFREMNTFRTRYELALEIPLGGKFQDTDTFLKTATEALWSTGKYERPSF